MKFVIILLVFLSVGLATCSSNSTHDGKRNSLPLKELRNNNISFDSTILSIEKESSGAESWDVLFHIKAFQELYENSSQYSKDAISFITNEDFSERQKMICLCVMQRCALPIYVTIVSKCKEQFDSGKMSEDVLAWAIVPNFSKSHPLVRNYSDNSVGDLLRDINGDKSVSQDLKKTVEKIMSGELWDNIKSIEGTNNCR